MNATQVFQTLSETEPFFTVSSSHRYRQKGMLREDELRFWREGRHCVADVIDFVGQNSFDSILDYGCGVGRLLRCMAPHAKAVRVPHRSGRTSKLDNKVFVSPLVRSSL